MLLPNHLHGIILLPERDGPRPVLGEIVRSFKGASTRMIRVAGNPKFAWQRDYYEHVIRTEAELQQKRRYIEENPRKWELDQEHLDSG